MFPLVSRTPRPQCKQGDSNTSSLVEFQLAVRRGPATPSQSLLTHPIAPAFVPLRVRSASSFTPNHPQCLENLSPSSCCQFCTQQPPGPPTIARFSPICKSHLRRGSLFPPTHTAPNNCANSPPSRPLLAQVPPYQVNISPLFNPCRTQALHP